MPRAVVAGVLPVEHRAMGNVTPAIPKDADKVVQVCWLVAMLSLSDGAARQAEHLADDTWCTR